MKREYINFYKGKIDDSFMVKIIDVTEEKEREKKEEELEVQLARECFIGREVKYYEEFSISIFKESRRLAFKMIGQPGMNVYEKNVLLQAREFARRYEKQFSSEEEFVITTNYS